MSYRDQIAKQFVKSGCSKKTYMDLIGKKHPKQQDTSKPQDISQLRKDVQALAERMERLEKKVFNETLD